MAIILNFEYAPAFHLLSNSTIDKSLRAEMCFLKIWSAINGDIYGKHRGGRGGLWSRWVMVKVLRGGRASAL